MRISTVHTEPFRLGVTGGRHFQDRAAVYAALDRVLAKRSIGVLVHGGAPGADELADAWARERGIQPEVHPADWRRLGHSAGPRRNQEMVDSGLNGLVSFPGGTGTSDMTRRAIVAGIPVWTPYGLKR